MPTVQTYSGAVYPTSGQAYSGVVYVNGEWNASTNIPSLASSVGIENYAYRVSAAGSTSLNGISDWNVDDFVIFSGGAWRKLTGKEVDVSALSGVGSGVAAALSNTVNSANGLCALDVSGNINIQGRVYSEAVDSYFGGSNPAAYNGLNVINTSPTGYCTINWIVGPSGANGYAGINYAPGLFYKIGVMGNDATSPIVFVNNNNQERARITPAGNVGIGTTSPAEKLRVVGATGTNQAGIGTAGNAVFINAYDNGGIFFSAATTTSTYFGLGSGSNIPVSIFTNNIDRVFIDTSGNVGIATATPTDKLDVNSDAMRLRTAKTPASATATGTQGQICWDSGYIYVCTATNTWKRAASIITGAPHA